MSARAEMLPMSFLLLSLEEEEVSWKLRGPKLLISDGGVAKLQKSFGVAPLSSGYWDHDEASAVFPSTALVI